MPVTSTQHSDDLPDLTVDDAAAQAGVDPGDLYAAVHSGEVPAVLTADGTYVVDPGHVRTWLAARGGAA